jgi:hypothetical protein
VNEKFLGMTPVSALFGKILQFAVVVIVIPE